ncbi:hypothetical protein Bealeia1_00005 [Candidatus Bealeia paramacronuclearis]|uniref:Uncharacterized protein n=1 Tax=Candidatus Bealeia paramacronuclearis TaxID=1921001 RepID=A0ABZ2BZY0_9PROT|nr:hypothetical protein [Candidatus Bealeia paramacronuclearis]
MKVFKSIFIIFLGLLFLNGPQSAIAGHKKHNSSTTEPTSSITPPQKQNLVKEEEKKDEISIRIDNKTEEHHSDPSSPKLLKVEMSEEEFEKKYFQTCSKFSFLMTRIAKGTQYISFFGSTILTMVTVFANTEPTTTRWVSVGNFVLEIAGFVGFGIEVYTNNFLQEAKEKGGK